MSKYCVKELEPGYDLTPKDADVYGWRDYMMRKYRTNYHAVRIASVTTRKLGDVVNNEAKVYDVVGLGVITASFVPTQVSSLF